LVIGPKAWNSGPTIHLGTIIHAPKKKKSLSDPLLPIYSHQSSLHTFHVFLLFAVRTLPIRGPPPLPSSSSLPVRGSGWPRCLPQALRAPTLIRSLSYTRVPNSLTWLLPPISSLGCFSPCAHHSSRSGLLGCTLISGRWMGGCVVGLYHSIGGGTTIYSICSLLL
jgi:hypothetical protein